MTLDGLMSRWMMPFWWACWIAWQTGTNSSSLSRGVRWLSSQYLVIGTPWTSSMTKYGLPADKSEARISKSETKSKSEEETSETPCCGWFWISDFVFLICFGFRDSDFGFDP